MSAFGSNSLTQHGRFLVYGCLNGTDEDGFHRLISPSRFSGTPPRRESLKPRR